ncbi:DUF1211 domain-containing protein [Glycomyces sp. L485]|uniref:TMEM175 family protein n=1 Tax=Glycomyces sp. L485 TaxID=2909235 RepID=UPI001F4A0D84|nr:DUF1211 domain-containing protein [Glycomyces sp. L485]MCH7232717.1 DUF1211 domain-containing protein [Glycomyces sp. L485]
MATDDDSLSFGDDRPDRRSVANVPAGVPGGDPEFGSPARLIGLSDGVYAIALTLLVLDISVADGLDPEQFYPALRQTLPQLGAYALSFVVIALFWRGHRRIFMYVGKIDGPLMRFALAGLGLVALFPFPTGLLAEYGTESLVVAAYAATVAAIDITFLIMLLRLRARPRLTKDSVDIRAVLPLRDLAVPVAVFLLSIPVAFLSASAGMWFWLLLVPAGFAAERHRRRSARPAA